MPPTPPTTGSTVTFRATIKKDGLPYDLTSATITLRLVKPDGTIADKAATITDAPNGIAQYTTLTTDLDVEGTWFKQWRTVKGGVTLWSEREQQWVALGG